MCQSKVDRGGAAAYVVGASNERIYYNKESQKYYITYGGTTARYVVALSPSSVIFSTYAKKRVEPGIRITVCNFNVGMTHESRVVGDHLLLLKPAYQRSSVMP